MMQLSYKRMHSCAIALTLLRLQLRSVEIPDIDCHSLPPGTEFSMCAGDFLEIYNEEGT